MTWVTQPKKAPPDAIATSACCQRRSRDKGTGLKETWDAMSCVPTLRYNRQQTRPSQHLNKEPDHVLRRTHAHHERTLPTTAFVYGWVLFRHLPPQPCRRPRQKLARSASGTVALQRLNRRDPQWQKWWTAIDRDRLDSPNLALEPRGEGLRIRALQRFPN
jgi:hypothetical protein